MNDHTPAPQARAPELTAQLLSRGGNPQDRTDRPVLVVGPSLGTSVTALWEPTIKYLDDTFTVVGWDLPGHGNQAPAQASYTIEQLADSVEVMTSRLVQTADWSPQNRIYAAGVSLSGVVMLALALRANTRFEALAMLCSSARIGTAGSWNERANLVAQVGTPTMVEGSAARWFAPGFIKTHPEIATSLLHSLQHTERHSYAYACRALAEADYSDNLSDISRPLLAIAGDQDTVCPPSDAEFISGRSINTEVAVLPGVGHLAPAEAPELTADLIKEHFNA
ncbi:alpha/beta fold hydrolase [Nesterenkonia ebinurensis]|uniref:alpha/beta fold hydrolase n=1 Tax=Nesterenkonia ebinurensis TaxID=2608252 RepID=UPI00168B9D3D|nr:alpha/beta fold hydrolase [Nesterenkonia ebinurensis]